jgi:hypothetical protein
MSLGEVGITLDGGAKSRALVAGPSEPLVCFSQIELRLEALRVKLDLFLVVSRSSRKKPPLSRTPW